MIIIIIDCLFVNEHQNWELQNQLKSLLQSNYILTQNVFLKEKKRNSPLAKLAGYARFLKKLSVL